MVRGNRRIKQDDVPRRPGPRGGVVRTPRAPGQGCCRLPGVVDDLPQVARCVDDQGRPVAGGHARAGDGDGRGGVVHPAGPDRAGRVVDDPEQLGQGIQTGGEVADAGGHIRSTQSRLKASAPCGITKVWPSLICLAMV